MSQTLFTGVYNAVQPLLTDGQWCPLQCDYKGALITAGGTMLASGITQEASAKDIVQELTEIKELLHARPQRTHDSQRGWSGLAFGNRTR
jgi:hypothetical protein